MADSTPSDSAIAEMVRHGMIRAREKLIDLTMRNGMLNFRHSETSNKHVRFADEKLEFVVDHLVSGQSFDIAALPPPDLVPPDEDTEDFREALKKAKIVDPEWLLVEEARRAAGVRRRTRDKSEERSLRDRVRTSLGMAPWLISIDPKERAKELGLNPSYDLPLPCPSEPAHHTDSKLQTLFYPEKLEPKLSAIYSAARTLQEDAGINALFCAVGYLEWYEADDTQNPTYAPLILIPVDIEKRLAYSEYVFSIQGRDEDVTTNVALKEKLRRHLSIELPDYDPEGSFESYLKEVAEAIQHKRRWRIRRWATLGVFSFLRQAMWKDLGPDNWPENSRPEAHQLLQQIFGDAPAGELDALAGVYDVDRPEIELKTPFIVTDADASQLSAVVDAADGKNMVVQGPPGTGKSQAITNIIATAMGQGKSVLFVSEKMAALNVVKDRLDHMGLGLYCLEVHSAKASKSLVLQSLRERMQSRPPRVSEADGNNARVALQQTRQRLTEYAELMNGQAGDTGLTVYEILWADFSHRAVPDNVPKEVLTYRFSDPLSINRFKRDEFIAIGTALDELIASMGASGDPRQQTWRGIGSSNLTRADRDEAVSAMRSWAACLENVQALCSALQSTVHWQKPERLYDLSTAVVKIREIPTPPATVIEGILIYIRTPETRKSLTHWVKATLTAREFDDKAEAICSRAMLMTAPDNINSLLQLSSELEADGMSVSDIRSRIASCQASLKMSELAADLLLRTAEASGQSSSTLDYKSETLLCGFLEGISSLAPELVKFRNKAFQEDSSVEAIESARKLASDASTAFSEAGLEGDPAEADPKSLPSIQELRRSADIILQTSFWASLFSGEYRAAKGTARASLPAQKRLSKDEVGRRLKLAAKWKEKLSLLEASFEAREAAGRHWRGLETPFDNLISVGEWTRRVRQDLPQGIELASRLRYILFEGSSDEIDQFRKLAAEAVSCGLRSTVDSAEQKRLGITQRVAEQRVCLAQFEKLLQLIETLAIKPNVPVKELKNARDALNQADSLRKSAETAAGRIVAECIPSGDAAERITRIHEALKHWEAVISCNLGEPIEDWLLSDQCALRTSCLQELGEKCAAATLEESSARNKADALLMLDTSQWCGAEFELASISSLRERALQAAASPEQLDKQIAILAIEDEAVQIGLGELIRAWRMTGTRYANISWVIRAAFYRSAADKLVREHPVLAKHTGHTHEQARQRFRQLDKEMMEINRRALAATVHKRPIPQGTRAQSTKNYTNYEMLSHQTGLQQPRIALRRLFGQAGAAIRALKPCIMMSPMSVAQYLEAGKHAFDLLVIDEASQMRPEDALGAMLRCSQAVIVGDPEQLPPTEFFMASQDESEEDAEDAPEESILELGRRSWRPMRMLDVHYRSRHQSLIAYSNQEFYSDKLLVYPSPAITDPDFGVSCRRIEGAYETGQGRNQIEARAIVDEAATLMRRRNDYSIGIVAINQAQRDLISKLIDELAATDADVEAYLQHWKESLEEFFVKNLENVQGDERDIILISTVYGPTAAGVFHQNFGPINKAYGHRRLNVLFTRAKRKLTVFTSLNHANIVTEGRARGVRVLREFLAYAETGSFQPGMQTGAEPDSDFERWFLERLKSAGYIAHPQVGVARFRIDIGIVHPEKPGTYILGVECDGATYHSSKSARDRDRLRQEVLEGLNWRIHRVWSTDWYRDPEQEFSRLVQTIKRYQSAA